MAELAEPIQIYVSLHQGRGPPSRVKKALVEKENKRHEEIRDQSLSLQDSPIDDAKALWRPDGTEDERVDILVMGLTGAGKSTFISRATGDESIPVGEGLDSGKPISLAAISVRVTC